MIVSYDTIYTIHAFSPSHQIFLHYILFSGIIKIFMESETYNTNLQGLVALSTLIMANREVGNIIAGKNNCIHRCIMIAQQGMIFLNDRYGRNMSTTNFR